MNAPKAGQVYKSHIHGIFVITFVDRGFYSRKQPDGTIVLGSALTGLAGYEYLGDVSHPDLEV